ncbi:hypothetical protein Tco_1154741, partial [Tanacetum coccineum]
YKRSLGEAFSLAIGKGFIDGISIGRKDPDVQAILKATPNVNPTSADIFMETYEKLFDVQAILKATPNEYNTVMFIPSYLILKGQRYTSATLINQRTSSNNQVVDQDKSST